MGRYDGARRLVETRYDDGTGTWETAPDQSLYTYDARGLRSEEAANVRAEGAPWRLQYRYTYEYNADSTLREQLYTGFDEAEQPSSWFRTQYTYADGRRASALVERLTEGAWVATRNDSYLYDEDSNLVELLREEVPGPAAGWGTRDVYTWERGTRAGKRTQPLGAPVAEAFESRREARRPRVLRRGRLRLRRGGSPRSGERGEAGGGSWWDPARPSTFSGLIR